MSEHRTFKCGSCSKELDILDIHHLPGEDIYDPISGMRYNSGKNYCKNCYDELTGQNVSKEELEQKFSPEDYDKIKDLKENQTNVNLLVWVTDKKEIQVEKNGRSLRLGKFKIKDDTGETELTLWENIIDEIDKGDRLMIKGGYIRTFMNQIQVTLGRKGVLTNLSE